MKRGGGGWACGLEAGWPVTGGRWLCGDNSATAGWWEEVECSRIGEKNTGCSKWEWGFRYFGGERERHGSCKQREKWVRLILATFIILLLFPFNT